MNSLNKISPKILLIASIIILTPIIMLLFSLLRQPTTTPQDAITPTPTLSTTPSTRPTPPPDTPTISLIRSAPRQDLNTYFLPIQPIELTFTEAVSPQDIRYETEPFTELEPKQGSLPSVIIISPTNRWSEGETKITILTETVSLSGARLNYPFEYTMRASFPPAPVGGGNY